jgi:tetratricopeptide (TPR) repeat protein
VARVHLNIGNLLSDTQPNKARAEYEESLKQSQAIGDQNGIAAAYSDLAIMLWSAGDRDGTEAALRNVLRIRRVTGSVEGQAWALANLAVLESDERASSEVIAEFREAAALDASIGDHAHRAYTLVSLSDVFRLRGELEEARRICTEALAEAAKVKDHGSDETTQYGCAQLALDRGDVAAAQAEIARARAAAVRINDLMMRTNTDVMLGQINAGQKDWPGALRLFRAAETEYAEGAVVTGQAVAASFVALGADAIGDARSRDAALARARALRSRITERREVIRADINLAELQGDNGQEDEAISQLHALAADARQRSWPGWALEAELAELHVLRKTGGMSRVAALKAQIAEEAKRLGFGWVLQRARRT